MKVSNGSILSIENEHGEFVPVGEIVDINIPIDKSVPLLDRPINSSGEFSAVLICEDDIGERLSIAFRGLGTTTIEACDAIEEFNKCCRTLSDSMITLADSMMNDASLWSEQIGAISLPDFIIHNNERFNVYPITDHSRQRDHGWYHKFNKPNGKRNLKR
tara:strand:+ start:692 stop:1171 length:480 start_codon:yes stop_codon:yes gene_type:complete